MIRRLGDWVRRDLVLAAQILWHQVVRDQLFTQAAALTYKTLFSLIPIFVLSLLVLSTISAGGGQSALDAAVKQMLFEQLGLDRMPLTDNAGNPLVNADGTEVTLTHFAEDLINGAKASVTNRTTGLIAFAVLLYGAISLMVVIESTFNLIFGSAKARSWSRRIMLYWCVLTLGPVGVAASISLGRSARQAAGNVDIGGLLTFANTASSFAVSWLVVLLMYRFIPEARVRWRPALVGAFFAALAWEAGKWAFGFYTQHALRNNWYGSIALLPLFMLWIYVTWSLVLLGLEITYLMQTWSLLRRRFLFLRCSAVDGVMLSDLRWVLSLGVLLYRRFKTGQVTEINDAAESLMIPNDVTRELMEALDKARIVHRVQGESYTLARPPESITAYDLLSAARAGWQVPAELACSAASPAADDDSAEGSVSSPGPGVCEFENMETAWARRKSLVDLAG